MPNDHGGSGAAVPVSLPARLLLLADSRLPAGGHVHSGGLEPAVLAGAVADVAGLAGFLRGRLATSGLAGAALAAAACAHASAEAPWAWARLDLEADARTPSPAQRRASRAQGRSLLRAARRTWPHPALDALAALREPHHPLVQGAAAAAAGGAPRDAAAISAYGAVTGPASAGVRLLGLDPLAVHRVLADLSAEIDAVAAEASRETGDWAALPATSAPALDLYAELHQGAEPRLFES
ncbi:urease accessory protein UreF [Actinomadura viridis]|uniref:Urease accessory protein UreF n=1 Tax=Actinomadura viridis TaxID=58110 RepID=A0A931DF52_9ACTN|nr:urease accessory UreF family protein [Actinomadura viridis]MBG6088072.1 urease accessory protein [Actinomadura viridis]